MNQDYVPRVPDFERVVETGGDEQGGGRDPGYTRHIPTVVLHNVYVTDERDSPNPFCSGPNHTGGMITRMNTNI